MARTRRGETNTPRWPRRCRRRAPAGRSRRRPGRSGSTRWRSPSTGPDPGTRPWDSPGMPSPVSLPKPRLAIWSSRRVSPRPWATSMVPMFDDWARIWVAVSDSVPCASASWKVYLPMGSAAGTDRAVFGRDQAVGQRRREGHQLEHRAGLVDLGDGRVGGRLGTPAGRVSDWATRVGPDVSGGAADVGGQRRPDRCVVAAPAIPLVGRRGWPWPGCRPSSRP